MNNNENSRIGVHCWGTKVDSVALLAPAAEAGARWVRATRPMQWDTITTGEPRGYDFAKGGEHSIDRALALGMSVMGILDARWGNETLHNDLPFASPVWEHLDLWSDFVTATVTNYAGRVNHWEVLNEPPFFWWYPVPEGVTVDEADCPLRRAPIRRYVEMLAATASAVRAADPTARIVLGSGFSDGAFLEKVYKLGGGQYFDIASVHYLPCDHPDKFARSMRRLRSVMAQYGDSAKPLWDTENGPSGAVIGQEVSTPEAYESLYNVYRHCFTHEFGLDRYFWFNPATKNAGNEPTYRALEVMHDVIGEGPLIRSRHIGADVHGYAFRGPEGAATILWSTAPAIAHFTQTVEGVTYLGEPIVLRAEHAMDGRPILVYGDILDQIDADITGKRTAVTPSIKQPPADAPHRIAHRLPPGDADEAWSKVPHFCLAGEMTLAESAHFVKVPSSVAADVKLAYDGEHLHLRAQVVDDKANPSHPEGVILMTVRDSDPDVCEWPYFTSGYGLFALYASPRGPMVLRYESSDIEARPTGRVDNATMTTTPTTGGYEVTASIPWPDIGPCRPGKHNPFLVTITCTRNDNCLGVPPGDEPEEWSHNFADAFIVKQPAAARWVTFAARIQIRG